ncbi:MAG: hypothetical protein L0219_06580, partial [Phycisphaerales bacterium]|nr:hypothetical protein [Phycisphaerales bacterium]
TEASITLITTALHDLTILRQAHSPAHDALRPAIWSDKSRIDSSEIDRLRSLWGRHFNSSQQ